MSEKKRIFYLDVIRAFSIIGVLFSHTASFFYKDNTLLWANLFIGSASLFFMTSGALIFPIKGGGVNFVKGRLKKILPQFLVWTVVYAVLAVFVKHDALYVLKDHVMWLLFYPSWNAAWFVYALIGLYLFAPVISPWLERASRRSVEYFLGLWLLSGLLKFASLHFHLEPQETIVAPFFNYVGYMVAGYYLTRWPLQERTKKGQTAFWAITFFLGVIFGVRATITGLKWDYAEVFNNDMSINLMAFNMLVFGLLSYVKTAPKVVVRTVTLVSVCSFGIYMSHLALAEYVFVPLNLGLWGTCGATLVASVLVGWVSTKLP